MNSTLLIGSKAGQRRAVFCNGPGHCGVFHQVVNVVFGVRSRLLLPSQRYAVFSVLGFWPRRGFFLWDRRIKRCQPLLTRTHSRCRCAHRLQHVLFRRHACKAGGFSLFGNDRLNAVVLVTQRLGFFGNLFDLLLDAFVELGVGSLCGRTLRHFADLSFQVGFLLLNCFVVSHYLAGVLRLRTLNGLVCTTLLFFNPRCLGFFKLLTLGGSGLATTLNVPASGRQDAAKNCTTDQAVPVLSPSFLVCDLQPSLSTL